MVYFLQEVSSNFDIQSANKFGEIRYVFKEGENRCSVFFTEAFSDEIIDKFIHLEFSENDYFVLTGGVVAISLTLAAIIQHFHEVSVLIYSVRDNAYVPRVIACYE